MSTYENIILLILNVAIILHLKANFGYNPRYFYDKHSLIYVKEISYINRSGDLNITYISEWYISNTHFRVILRVSKNHLKRRYVRFRDFVKLREIRSSPLLTNYKDQLQLSGSQQLIVVTCVLNWGPLMTSDHNYL
jgi:hypothetical protein